MQFACGASARASCSASSSPYSFSASSSSSIGGRGRRRIPRAWSSTRAASFWRCRGDRRRIWTSMLPRSRAPAASTLACSRMAVSRRPQAFSFSSCPAASLLARSSSALAFASACCLETLRRDVAEILEVRGPRPFRARDCRLGNDQLEDGLAVHHELQGREAELSDHRNRGCVCRLDARNEVANAMLTPRPFQH